MTITIAGMRGIPLTVAPLILAVPFVAGFMAASTGIGAVVGIALVVLGLAARHLRRRLPSSPLRLDMDMYHWPLLVLQLVIAFGIHSLTGAALAVSAIGGYQVVEAGRGGIRPRALTVLPLALLAAALLVWVRPEGLSSLPLFAFPLLAAATVLVSVMCAPSRESALLSTIDGVGVYLLVSVVAYFGGLRSPFEGVRSVGLETTFGMFDQRLLFPFSSSIDVAPAMAAGYIAAVGPLLLALRRGRMFRVLCAAAGAYVLLGGNVRVALLFALLLGGLSVTRPEILRRAAVPLVAGMLVMPFVYPAVQGAVTGIVEPSLEGVGVAVRPGERIGSLNGRDYVWSRSLEFYACCMDGAGRVVGAGVNGHATSGASERYADRFAGFARDRRLVTPHNSALQTLFDGGAVGLFLWGAGLLGLTWAISRSTREPWMVTSGALGMTLGLVGTGMVQVAAAPGPHQGPWWVLLIMAVTMSYGGETEPTALSVGAQDEMVLS